MFFYRVLSWVEVFTCPLVNNQEGFQKGQDCLENLNILNIGHPLI